MIKLLTFLVVGGYLYFSLKSFFSKKKPVSETAQHSEIADEELVEDPYCHTFIAVQSAYPKTIQGKKTLFCSEDCANKFQLLQENN